MSTTEKHWILNYSLRQLTDESTSQTRIFIHPSTYLSVNLLLSYLSKYFLNWQSLIYLLLLIFLLIHYLSILPLLYLFTTHPSIHGICSVASHFSQVFMKTICTSRILNCSLILNLVFKTKSQNYLDTSLTLNVSFPVQIWWSKWRTTPMTSARAGSRSWTSRPTQTASSSCPRRMAPTTSWSPANWISQNPAGLRSPKRWTSSPTCSTAKLSSSMYETHTHTHSNYDPFIHSSPIHLKPFWAVNNGKGQSINIWR